MGWDKLTLQGNDEANEKNKEAAIELAKAFSRCFKTQDGEKVLSTLVSRFVMNNPTPLNAPNIEYEAGYHDGEAGLVHFIINQVQKAEVI